MNKTEILKWIGIILVVCILLFAIKVVLLPVKTVTEQLDSAGNIIEKTYDSDNAIYNYEWFKTQFEKINANREQIKTIKQEVDDYKLMYGNVSTWDYQTKEEYSRLNSIKIGLINQDKNLVAEYNARSKMANRNIFNDKLPFYVDDLLW